MEFFNSLKLKKENRLPSCVKGIKNNSFPAFILIGIYILFFSIVSYSRYYSFDYNDFDLAHHSQTLWSLIHNSIHCSILGIDFIGNHANFILFLIAPLYLLFQSPLLLLFIQTFVLGLTGYPLYLIAKEHIGKMLALSLLTAYLMYPALGYVNLFEFHPTVFAPLFLTSMYYFFTKGNFRYFTLFMILALFCQENIALIIIAFGIYSFFVNRDRRWALTSFLTGSCYFFITVGFIIPYFNQNTIQFISIYKHMGSNLAEVIVFILSHPLEVFKMLFTAQKIKFLLSLFSPLLFLPLFSVEILIILPIFMQHLLSARVSEHTIYYHYTAEMLPFIFIPVIYSLKKILIISFVKRYIRRRFIAIIIVFAAVTSNLFLGPHIEKAFTLGNHINSESIAHKKRFLSLIPAEASVIATFEFLPRLANRKNLYSFHHLSKGTFTLSDRPFILPDNVNYCLINCEDQLTFNNFYTPGITDKRIRDFIAQGNWGVEDMNGSLVFLMKNTKSKYDLYKICEKECSSSHLLKVNINKEIELTGIDIKDYANDPNDLVISFYWTVLEDVCTNYGVVIEIEDKNNLIVRKYIKPVCYNIYPIFSWKKGEIIKEDYVLPVFDKLGNDFKVNAGFFDFDTYRMAESVNSDVCRIKDGFIQLFPEDD